MKTIIFLLLLPIYSLFANETAVFQVSTFSALTEGVFEGKYPYKELFKKGNFGLGTFHGTNGEMVALDGEFYQDSPNGQLHKVQPSQTTPFAAVTFFSSTLSKHLKSSKNFHQLGKAILPLIEQKNTPHALKIVGSFRHLHLRSLKKQEQPYPKLTTASKEQHEYDFYNIEGTLVGFWFPHYLDGINVGGFHFHFLSADKRLGGHILDVSTKNATCYFQPCQNLNIYFPNTESFSQANLENF